MVLSVDVKSCNVNLIVNGKTNHRNRPRDGVMVRDG